MGGWRPVWLTYVLRTILGACGRRYPAHGQNESRYDQCANCRKPNVSNGLQRPLCSKLFAVAVRLFRPATDSFYTCELTPGEGTTEAH
jgi:hypothetical protein